MRKTTSYPHPVLGNSDDFSAGKFALKDNSVWYSVDTEHIRIKGVFELEHATLQSMLECGEASLVIRMDCDKTSFRCVYKSSGPKFEITVPAESVRARIELEALLVANCPVPEYRPLHVNPLYGSEAVFSVQNGDLLAYAGAANLPINLRFDPLVSPLGSIIRIQSVDNRSVVGLELNPTGNQSEYFVIEVPQDMWETVSNNRSTPAILAPLVLPSLVEVLHLMRQAEAGEENDIHTTDWYKNLLSLIQHRRMNLDNDEPLEIAQQILSMERDGSRFNPITLAFPNLS